jgi:hypothetical protein
MTKEWFQFLISLREEVKEGWATSIYVGATAEETLQRNAAAIGQVDLLSRLLEAKVSDIDEVNYDNK